MRGLLVLLSDPVLVRLDGRKQSISWSTVRAGYADVFGPRVREAVNAGKLVRVGHD